MTVIPPGGSLATGSTNEFEVALRDGLAKTAAADAAKAGADESPTMQSTLDQLRAIVGEPETPPAAPAAPADPAAPAAPAAPAEPASKAEIDKLMKSLEDEPESVRTALRRALEEGMEAREAVAVILEHREKIIAESNLVKEVDGLSKLYPSFTPADLKATLDHLAKLPPVLAENLSLEEVARRTLGSDTLEQRKAPLAAPAKKDAGNPADLLMRPAPKRPAAAEIIGDATPSAPMGHQPFDAGSGNNFNDLASFIVKKHGADLIKPGR